MRRGEVRDSVCLCPCAPARTCGEATRTTTLNRCSAPPPGGPYAPRVDPAPAPVSPSRLGLPAAESPPDCAGDAGDAGPGVGVGGGCLGLGKWTLPVVASLDR